MADTILQLVARLESVSGLSEDSTENVLHAAWTDAFSEAEVTAYMEAFRDFFTVNGGAPQTATIGSYIAESVSRGTNKCHILAYSTDDLSGETPFGAPLDVLDFTMPASGGGDPFPEEVACVLSYHGDLSGVPVTQANPTPPPLTIRPQQRRRGRMYVGPLNTNATVGGAQVSRPSSAFRTNLIEAFEDLWTAFDAVIGNSMVVWSRADEAFYDVQGGWVDDAWDVQRRRGAQPTLRQLFTTV